MAINRPYRNDQNVESSTSIEQRPAPLSSFNAKQAIHTYLDNGDIIPTQHCHQRMRERRVTMPDIVYVLRHGAITEQPRWNPDHHNYVYKIEGFDLEDDELKVLSVIIDIEATVLLITVI